MTAELSDLKTRLRPCFDDPVCDSQAAFRALMNAIAYPGRIELVNRLRDAPPPLHAATATLCLTLADFETPLWIDPHLASTDVLAWLQFHCRAPIVTSPKDARFVLADCRSQVPHLDELHPGEVEYPERSSTLILQVASLSGREGVRWTGPGINGTTTARISTLPRWFWAEWAMNSELYPLGADVIFASGEAIVGLPRSVRVEA
ncbi:phosphonate C-P lyase system protein PhnH [Mesorhizobium tianshanense]|uniref:Alpha-D-ribose 1-methylphosphonate 5-triphosphate synthase subunit PhnH n=1 Tax=Mesorhizobium tianshanense TaxID=39844 RepID=A0A562NLP9_9HYPH|nr:phosphonate C-P lyase system protein PhnH [Mesorhizobium tianshanense]TWI33132.1 alpha-D-ribose 1-methylphosphonate 5-triphosphate synthase subunit PhnH [Mesorhizobium tianshanense]